MDSFNVGQKINDDQSVTLAIDLLEVFGHENLEDVVLMFKLARQGRIGGKIFRIDNQVVFSEWVPAYLELKAIERENIWQSRKSKQNDLMRLTDELSNDDIMENIKSWEPGLNEKENNKKNLAPGLGSTMRKWLGQNPLLKQWGNVDNIDNAKFIENKTKNSK
tara:strand:+ start:12522 stop:13010 length:489 start_codon:yes stop_codon:yes gene_type:complete